MNTVLERSEARVREVVTCEKPTNESDRASAFLNRLLADQGQLTAVERFSRFHDSNALSTGQKLYRKLLPARQPAPGEQYAFEVNLDKCSGCKACVSACHSLNGLEEHETWRKVGLLVDQLPESGTLSPHLQHITTACHHCIDPACLNGCPVLAYEKDPFTGIVHHLDDQCMGCSYCVMKCPYEVPKFSSSLGIVRKCDMCATRLSAGEAPACVQGCPNEAITISLVKQSTIVGQLTIPAADSKPWLPDSPDPSITLPTTRFTTQRPLPRTIRAADNRLRLDHAHWPLVFMLVLTQAAAGLFLIGALARLAGLPVDPRILSPVGLAILCAGLGTSVLHLGRPTKAWRAFLGWRRSWLSREILGLNAFAGTVVAFTTIAWLPGWGSESWPAVAGILAAAAGLVGVFTSVMVYVDTCRPFWCARNVFLQFYGTTILLGLALTTILLTWSQAPAQSTKTAGIVALIFQGGLFTWRRLEFRRALLNQSSPVHLNARVVHKLLPWSTSLGTALFAASAALWIFAFVDLLNATSLWVSFAAAIAFVSEINERYVFFTASASKRMPGGVNA